jgi:hypothetical protein
MDDSFVHLFFTKHYSKTLIDTCLNYDTEMTVKILFHKRDCRKGQGYRKLFFKYFKYLKPEIRDKYYYLIPTYGTWKDLFDLWYLNPVKIANIVTNQLQQDIVNLEDQNLTAISLLAKWLPKDKLRKKFIANKLNLKESIWEKELRTKYISPLRKHLGLIESQLSSNNISCIDMYNVPIKAQIKYQNILNFPTKINLSYYNLQCCIDSIMFKVAKLLNIKDDETLKRVITRINEIKCGFNFTNSIVVVTGKINRTYSNIYYLFLLFLIIKGDNVYHIQDTRFRFGLKNIYSSINDLFAYLIDSNMSNTDHFNIKQIIDSVILPIKTLWILTFHHITNKIIHQLFNLNVPYKVVVWSFANTPYLKVYSNNNVFIYQGENMYLLKMFVYSNTLNAKEYVHSIL